MGVSVNRDLLKGPSAYVLLGAAVRMAFVTGGWYLFLLLLMWLKVPGSWFTTTLVLMGFLPLSSHTVSYAWSSAKERAEKRAGYTTFPFRYKELEQRDPYLGAVIRAAGEDYLDGSEFSALVQRSRALARMIQPTGSMLTPPTAAFPKGLRSTRVDSARKPYRGPALWIVLFLGAVLISAWGGEQLTPTGTDWYSTDGMGWNPAIILIMWITGQVPVSRGTIAILSVLLAALVIAYYLTRRRRTHSGER